MNCPACEYTDCSIERETFEEYRWISREGVEYMIPTQKYTQCRICGTEWISLEQADENWSKARIA